MNQARGDNAVSIKIALAGNPNSGKTTLFNALTGSNQFVGNWPGVTVEKKEGKLKGHPDVTVTDLPGIYSMSPYTIEEVVARNYLIDEQPDVILNIVDGTNLERNLFLTTQLTEIGIPVVVAINMMDVVDKAGDKINIDLLGKSLGCKVVAISALKSSGIKEASEAAIEAAKGKPTIPQHGFSGSVEHALAHIEEIALHDLPDERQRWYAIKIFERDEKIVGKLSLASDVVAHIEGDIKACEQELDDDSESIITSERYEYIDSIIKKCLVARRRGALTASDKIDKVVTNRWLAIPIFAIVMFIVYYVSVTTVGGIATDWANDGVFGDGWHLFAIGASEYEEAAGEYETERLKIESFIEAAEEQGIDVSSITETLESDEPNDEVIASFIDEARAADVTSEIEVEGDDSPTVVNADSFEAALEAEEPDPASYGVWVPGVPVIIENGLEAVDCAAWLQDLIINGIVAGVGAVLGFVPQMLILFIFLAFLEACGYMARIAFIMDRIFRRFGLSGKSFIPILIGTGCGVPGIMASRTIENERDRRMTVMLTTFIPCGAKLPIIALIAGAMFGGAAWVSPSAYFVGMAAIILSGILLKKTKMFSGDVAPFVMELPAYRWPTVGNVLRSMWERGWSFIKKAGTIILLATIFVWFTSGYGFTSEGFGAVDMQDSILAKIGNSIAWLFTPLGWGDWKSAVAAVTGLIAKENIISTFGVLFNYAEVAEDGFEIWANLAANYTKLAAYSLLLFNLLCAPCFAAMGAIKREMNNAKWFWFAIGYQCVFAYFVAFVVFQLGTLFTGGGFSIATVFAIAALALFVWLVVRRDKYKDAKPQIASVKLYDKR